MSITRARTEGYGAASRSSRRRTATLAATALVAALLVTVAGTAPALAAPGEITTVAFPIEDPWGVDEVNGELYVTQSLPGLVSHVDAEGVITPFAGGGTIALGDGGPATAASVASPEGLVFDAGGNLFFSDRENHRVRRVAAGADGVVDGDADETIVTVAGTGTGGFSGDDGPATAAEILLPDRLAVDGFGNLFFSDEGNNRVRRVLAGADGVVDGDLDETIVTVAGNGSPFPDGDGGPATAAGVTARALAFDTAGNLYIGGGNLVRLVTTGADSEVSGEPDEIITTYAGGGFLLPGPSNEGAIATDVALDNVYSIAFDAEGSLYLVSTDIDVRNHVLRVNTDGILTTAVGAGPLSSAGDGGPGIEAGLNWPYGLSFDADGNLYVGELLGHVVRQVVPGADGVVDGAADETIARLAGTGIAGFGGDAGLATEALLNSPAGLATSDGGVYIADRSNNRVRRVDSDGIITTVAGGGTGDGLPAAEAAFVEPRGVVVDGDGNVLIADCGNSRVRMVDTSGVVSTLLGSLPCPSGLHLVDSGPEAGTLYIALAGGHRVVKRSPAGLVTTVAGTGAFGFAGDGGPATEAELDSPHGVHVDGSGNVYIADTDNNRIRRVDAETGEISTVAGDGSALFGIPGGVPATSTSVVGPSDVVVDDAGNRLITEMRFSRLRKVDTAGVISTIAGNGIPGYGGDGGPASAAVVSSPTQLDLNGAGDLFFTDRGNERVRRIEAGTSPPPPASKTIQCGSVVTRSVTLKRDVGPCEGDGLVVGADNIRINLNGHRVFGTEEANGAVGIRLTGRSGVTITGPAGRGQTRGGAISGFDAGVAIIGGADNVVENLVAEDNVGFDIYGDGIATFFSSYNVIRNNLVTRNGWYDGIGILGIGSQGNLVQGNTVTASTAQGEIVGAGIGIVLTPFLDEGLPREQAIFDNRVVDNVVRDNDNSGISNISNNNGEISGNLVEGNGKQVDAIPANGIGIQNLRSAPKDTFVLVRNNTVRNNGSHDADGNPSSGDGINITSQQNLVLRNTIEGSVFEGISVVGSRNQIENNRVIGNGREGILVTSHENSVRGNQVHGNVGSGIKAEFGASANRFETNDAADNGEFFADFEGGFFQADLVDVNADFQDDPFLMIFNCDANIWTGNRWGSGGFFPDPALSDPDNFVLIEEACTAFDRQGPALSVTRATAATTARRAPAERAAAAAYAACSRRLCS